MRRWVILIALLDCGVRGAELGVNGAGQIEVRGSDLRVFRDGADAPLFGSVTRHENIVRFTPALPFAAGGAYRVEVETSKGAWSTHSLRIPELGGGAPTVSMLVADTVYPANALKFYLQFSQAMEQGVFLDRITLLRRDGRPVPGAFRETELWSPDGRRLTLWLHPGRQKAGVNLNMDEGPVLVEGEMHMLKIAASWRSAHGVELGKTFSFPIIAGATDHQCPEPKLWRVITPKRGTCDTLRIVFDEPLDPAMLRSAIQVRMGGLELQGAVDLPPDAKSWAFRPEDPWPSGEYEITIDPLLEDLAGNNLQHSFEVDREQTGNPKPVTTSLSFKVE